VDFFNRLTGNDQRKRAEQERQALEEARRKALQRAQQSSNQRVSQQATQRLQNNAQQMNLAKPTQSLGNRVRDVFDSNTEADYYRRSFANKTPVRQNYRDQQLSMGNARPYENLGSQLVGNTARFLNTGAAGLRETADTAKMYTAQLTDNDKAYQATLKRNNMFKQTAYQPNSGLLGAGTIYNNPEEFNTLSALETAKRVGATTVGTAGEVIPVGKGLTLAGKGAQATLGTTAKLVGQGGLASGMASVGNQQLQYGRINPTQVATDTALGGLMTGGLGLAGRVIPRKNQIAPPQLKPSKVVKQLPQEIKEKVTYTDRLRTQIDVTKDAVQKNVLVQELQKTLKEIADWDKKQGQGGFVRIPGRDTELMVTHNLSADNLAHAKQLGGLPQPSIGIVDPRKTAIDGFGEITLVGNNNLVDPRIRGTRTFASDAYTPRQPKSELKKGPTTRNQLDEYFGDSVKTYGDNKPINLDAFDSVDEALAGHPAVMGKFLEENGIKPNKGLARIDSNTLDAQIHDAGLSAKYRVFLQDNLENLGDRKVSDLQGIFMKENGLKPKPQLDYHDIKYNLRKQITDSDLNDKFNEYTKDVAKQNGATPKIYGGTTSTGTQRWLDETMDNVLKTMRKNRVRAGEQGFGSTGSIAATKAKITKEFRSIDDIVKNKDKLTNQETMESTKALLEQKMEDLHGKLEKYAQNQSSNRFTDYDLQMEAISDYVAGGRDRKWFFQKFQNVPDKLVKELDAFRKELQDAPTEYFESVSDRAVKLNEFEKALIPEGLPKAQREAIVAQLNAEGIQPRFYKDGQRQQALIDLMEEDNALRSTSQDTNNTKFNQKGFTLPLSESPTLKALKIVKESPKSKGVAPKSAPKPIRTVFDTDKIYQANNKSRKEVIDAAVGEEVTQQRDALKLWQELNKDIKNLGGINKNADELQGGYSKLNSQVNRNSGQKLDEIAQELSSTGKYGNLSPQELLDLLNNKPQVAKVADIKNRVINELEDGKHQYSQDYLKAQKELDKRKLELADVPVTAKIVDKPDTRISNAEWQSLQETAPMEAKSTRQAVGGELASVRKELEATKKLAVQLQERQKLEVIQGKTNVASKMREANAKIYEDIIKLQKRERELAKQYATESPVDNRVNMSDPKNVKLDGITERYNSSLKDKSKKKMFEQLSKDYLGDVEAAKIIADKKALNFTAKHKLTPEQNLETIRATNDPTIKGVSPQVKKAVDDLHKTYDELYAYFTKDKKIDMGYQHDYYPKEYVNVKTGDQMTAAEYSLLQRASGRTKGRVTDELADWKLKYSDPADGLKSYYANLEKAAAGRKYLQELEQQGLVAKGDGAPMQGYRPIIAEGLQNSDGTIYYAKKEVADKLNTMFGSQEATNMLENALEKGEGLNSFWQSVVLSGGIPNTPINAFGFMQVMKETMALHPIKAAKAVFGGVNKDFSQKFFESKAGVMAQMAKEGIPIRYSLSEGSKKGIGRTKQAFNERGAAQGINQAWNELTNDATFGRFMPMLEVQHFENIYKHGIKKGLSPKQALKIAGESTKNFYGVRDLYSKATRARVIDSASGTFLFAPRFRESMLNFWVKNAKTLGVADGKWNALKPEYRDNAKFLVASALTFAAYDMLNKELNGTHLWENPDGKKDKLLIPGVDPNGKTLGIPFLPSIATVPRNAGMFAYNLATGNFGEAGKNLGAFASMPVKTATELLTNENYFGQQIVDPDASTVNKLTQGGAYLGRSLLQPWAREGLNVVGQGLPEGVKDAVGIKKKSGLETVSNALESPVRFYDPKYMRGGGDNFKQASGKTNGQIKAEKNSKMTLEDAKKMQAKEYDGKYARMTVDEVNELAKTDPEAASYKKSYDATLAAYGATPDLPTNLNDSAKKVIERSSRLTPEGKDKWNKLANNDPTVKNELKAWNNGRDVPVTNEVAKQWAEYKRDEVEGKISKLDMNDKKKAILRSGYESQLDEDTRKLLSSSVSKAELQGYIDQGLLTDTQIANALEVEKQMFDAGIVSKEYLASKLGLSARGYKGSGGRGGKVTASDVAKIPDIGSVKKVATPNVGVKTPNFKTKRIKSSNNKAVRTSGINQLAGKYKESMRA
jgi:hypothetical protein